MTRSARARPAKARAGETCPADGFVHRQSLRLNPCTLANPGERVNVVTGRKLEDVAGTIHAQPALGEALQEAVMRALGHVLHI